MEEARPMIHIRLPKHLIKKVDHVAVDWDKDRAKTIESLLDLALQRIDEREIAHLHALEPVAAGR